MKPPAIARRAPAAGRCAAGVCALLLLSLAGCAYAPNREALQHPAPVPVPVTVPMPGPMPEAVAAAEPAAPRGAIFRPVAASSGWALFEDRRPRNVGDVLTIVLRESSSASKSSAANASRNAGTNVELGVLPRALGGLLRNQDADISGSNALTAKGGANASNSFNGVISVKVVGLLANGNLVVSGDKQMLINQGTETIRFSGLVDPRTVGPNSTVLSTQVADARIEYSARGYIDEAQTMGWLQRFFLNVLPL
ncbi:flagellar basal body L-ring protein FlgH [Ramlibacter tataouinensis]|uniref:flagellar basal body L-ring protein FlgH n=1 Tax=Ramlibacter tataouinensis TaxID=94132 RepID=UPI0022F3D4CF|nr:flagellar basal body L-ring protein FlgH [Ramlibacter tataouinensis]WBY00596.1 flagellar basal body L-ring protein FlgH [Ramlibacter tataouinensis]